jgi:hypothetical protein
LILILYSLIELSTILLFTKNSTQVLLLFSFSPLIIFSASLTVILSGWVQSILIHPGLPGGRIHAGLIVGQRIGEIGGGGDNIERIPFFTDRDWQTILTIETAGE